MYTNMPEKIPL